METIDRFVLAQFQKFSDQFQILFGKNNFTLARICLVVMMSSIICRCLITYYLAESASDRALEVMTIVLFMFIFGRSYSATDKLERQCLSRPQTKNYLEQKMRLLRSVSLFIVLYMLTMSIQGFIEYKSLNDSKSSMAALGKLATAGFVLFFIGYVYFMSCTPRPKQKSKIKKVIEKLDKVFTPQPTLAHARASS